MSAPQLTPSSNPTFRTDAALSLPEEGKLTEEVRFTMVKPGLDPELFARAKAVVREIFQIKAGEEGRVEGERAERSWGRAIQGILDGLPILLVDDPRRIKPGVELSQVYHKTLDAIAGKAGASEELSEMLNPANPALTGEKHDPNLPGIYEWAAYFIHHVETDDGKQRVVGMSGLYRDLRVPNEWWLGRFGVSKDQQGSGLAEKILFQAIEYARVLNPEGELKLFTESGDFNRRAQRFYEKRHWQRVDDGASAKEYSPDVLIYNNEPQCIYTLNIRPKAPIWEYIDQKRVAEAQTAFEAGEIQGDLPKAEPS